MTPGMHNPMGREAHLPWVRTAIFAVALAISAALHGIVLIGMPPLPAWNSPSANLRRPARPLALNDVRPIPDSPGLIQPETFRPENPSAVAAVESLQKNLVEVFRAEAEILDFIPPPPSEADAPLPTQDPDFAIRDFRQDILEIERKVVAEELAALPRRWIPALERVDSAPDITLPSTAAAIAAAAAASAGRAENIPLHIPQAAVLTQATPEPAEMILAANQAELSPSERLIEQGQILDEAPADVSDIQPIEQMLAVAVSTFRAPFENSLYFELSISRSGTESLPVLPKDILLIQDCSESITRTKLDYFKDGLEAYLRTLTTADRINLMRYSETPTLCFPTWEPATASSLTRAVTFVDSMRARGQTDLFAPLQQVLKLPRDPARPMIAVLLTDGRPTMGTIRSSEIIARFSQLNNNEVSIFTIGAGEQVNTFLLDLLGHNNRGGSSIMPLREQIPDTVQRAARELSRPVLANLEYRFSGNSAAEVYPPSLTHLYLDRPLRLIGRCPLDQETTILQIIGESRDQKRDMVFAIDLTTAESGGEGLRREWVAQKIYKLINDHIADGRAETIQQIRALSIQHNVPLPYGSDFPL